MTRPSDIITPNTGSAVDESQWAVNWDVKEIMARIPQRYPFLLVDRVTHIEPGKWIAG
jgi:hypothetical protein